MSERIITPEPVEDDTEEITLRPATLDAFVGQEPAKNALRIAIAAAQQRGEPIDHILFAGPPGLGKTTLAHIIAREMGAAIRTTTGPVLEKPGDIAALVTALQKGDVLFIDEIHRMNPVVEEILYPAMEDFFIDVMIGEGPSARSIKLTLEHFTLIGATTRQGLLSSPFRDRFGIIVRLNLYSPEEIIEIVKRSAAILKIPVTPKGAATIAARSRGTPRIGNRLLRRVRDYAVVKGDGMITSEIAQDGLALLQIDELGLDDIDRRIISVIADDFSGGPVGVKTIAISVGEEVRTIEEVYEPYLIQIGFVKRTSQGRETTPAALAHLKLNPSQKTLF